MTLEKDWIPQEQPENKEVRPPLLHTKPRRNGPPRRPRASSEASAEEGKPERSAEVPSGPPPAGNRGSRPPRDSRGRPFRPRSERPGGGKPSRSPYAHLPNRFEVNDADKLEEQGKRLGSAGDPIQLSELLKMSLKGLDALGEDLQADFSGLEKGDREGRIHAIMTVALKAQRPLHDRGVLQIREEGFGLLLKGEKEVKLALGETFVPLSVIKKYDLRQGQNIAVQVHSGQPGQVVPYALQVLEIMGRDPSEAEKLTNFFDLPVEEPHQRIAFFPALGGKPKKKAVKRVAAKKADLDPVLGFLDRLAPLAKGQRYLVNAPSRTGKSYLFQQLCRALPKLCPKTEVCMLLLDARPEEIAQYEAIPKLKVSGTTFSELPPRHVHLAETTLEYAKRQVEIGNDVILLVDSLTKLHRAYTQKFTYDRSWEGNARDSADQAVKRWWGSGRAIEGGASLTLIGSMVRETEDRDPHGLPAILSEMANAEVTFSRDLARRRIYPALNCHTSGTLAEEKLFTKTELEAIFQLRNEIGSVPLDESLEMVRSTLPI